MSVAGRRWDGESGAEVAVEHRSNGQGRAAGPAMAG